MLAGRRPFTGTYDGALLFDLLYNEPDYAVLERTGAPPALVEIVRRCLKKNPDERYASADALARDLDAAKAASAEALTGAVPPAAAPEPLIVVASASAPLDDLPRPGEASPPPAAPLVIPTGALAVAPTGAVATPTGEVALPPTPAATDRPAGAAGSTGGRRLRVPLYVPAAMAGILVVAVAALLLASRSSDDPPAAVLAVTTTPPGAAVYLDGRLVGMTPLEGLDVAPGEASVALRLEGFAAVDTVLAFEAGAPSALALTLAPAEGLTQAEAEALAEQAVALAEEAGVQPDPGASDALPIPSTLPPLRPSAPEEQPGPSEPAPSRPEPEPAATQMATLVLGVEPAGAVAVDGQGERGGGSFPVTAGAHTVTFVHPRYGRHRVNVTVGPGETRRMTCYFETRVRVAARLEGADGPAPAAAVTVDGQNAGFTPTTLTLGPGTHRIAVSRTGFQSLDGTQTVTVEPSLEPATRSLSFRLAPQ
jgi:serine/threonine-protein kinase